MNRADHTRQQTAIDRFIAEHGADAPATHATPVIQPVPVQASIGWVLVGLLAIAALIAVGVVLYLRASSGGTMVPPDWGKNGAQVERWRPFEQMDSRWDEALDVVERTKTMLAVHTAMHGEAGDLGSGAVVDQAALMSSFDDPKMFDRLSFFDRRDFVLEVRNNKPFEWVLSVSSSSADGPTGTYRVDQAGIETFEDN
ncbi:MAG: hypothetical protein AB7K09_05320 [Planctomycetota bacterium]